jgi:uncharacterized protein (DUF58 family)
MNLDLNKIREFQNIEMLARQMVEGFITGLHKSPYHGFSVEFAEHRLYNAGESTRHIDWKVFAKSDRLYTKRYEEETNLRCNLIIDTSSSMYYPQETNGKITFSIMCAASIAYLLHKQRDAVGLFTFSDKIELEIPVKSTPSHLHKLYLEFENLLSKKPERQSTAVSDTLHDIARKIHRRSLVIIFSDMLENQSHSDQVFSALQHLKHNKHEVLLFHINDKKTEMDFEFEDRPYEFIDIESGNKIKLQPFQVKETYRKIAKTYYQNLKLKTSQLKIDFIEADINEGYEKVLTSYLIKRAKMR